MVSQHFKLSFPHYELNFLFYNVTSWSLFSSTSPVSSSKSSKKKWVNRLSIINACFSVFCQHLTAFAMCRSRKLISSSPRLLKLSMMFLSLREQEKLKIPFRRMNSSYFILNETNQKSKTSYSATLKTNTTFQQLLDTFIGNLWLSVPLDIASNNSAWSSDSTSRCGSDCGEKKNKILDYSSA